MKDMSSVNFHPILFSTLMVQAILAGNKTMTRRIVKPQPDDDGLWNDTDLPRSLQSTLKGWNGSTTEGESKEWKCKFGQVGDILWVRETFKYNETFKTYLYKATYNKDSIFDPWKPSIHMPKAACRLFLKISDIRVERLQDISDTDANKEGAKHYIERNHPLLIITKYPTPSEDFKILWRDINGSDSWESNPWVWVISFERIEKPENF